MWNFLKKQIFVTYNWCNQISSNKFSKIYNYKCVCLNPSKCQLAIRQWTINSPGCHWLNVTICCKVVVNFINYCSDVANADNFMLLPVSKNIRVVSSIHYIKSTHAHQVFSSNNMVFGQKDPLDKTLWVAGYGTSEALILVRTYSNTRSVSTKALTLSTVYNRTSMFALYCRALALAMRGLQCRVWCSDDLNAIESGAVEYFRLGAQCATFLLCGASGYNRCGPTHRRYIYGIYLFLRLLQKKRQRIW